MKYLIIILLIQALLFGLLFIKKMKGKYVFTINGILFFILFGIPHFKILLSEITSEAFGFETEYLNISLGGAYIGIWIISIFIFNLLFPFLLSFLPIGLHKSIFYKKTNSKY